MSDRKLLVFALNDDWSAICMVVVVCVCFYVCARARARVCEREGVCVCFMLHIIKAWAQVFVMFIILTEL